AYSAAVSARFAFYIAAAMHFGPSVAVIITRGNVGWPVKVLLFTTDIVFAGAFAAMRIVTALSLQAVSVSLIEFALLLVHTLTLISFARRYAKDATPGPGYRIAVAKAHAERDRFKEKSKRGDRAFEKLRAQHAEVHKRELSARRTELDAVLGATTARTAHYGATGKLVASQASNPTADSLAACVEDHLKARIARLHKGGTS
ncbi:MAG: hypothetical protein JWO36_2007, partial [Myxococcales bacterium]|nr:hypothetical protein [Myxococcales bacterium]